MAFPKNTSVRTVFFLRALLFAGHGGGGRGVKGAERSRESNGGGCRAGDPQNGRVVHKGFGGLS